ncbi:MAG TPA: hypothetical protein VGB50_10330 [Flavobacterium sp.]|jgi:hypothetical protein
MKQNTFEAYKKGIRAKYELAKVGDYSTFLLEPSPAKLRDFCMLIFDRGLSKADEGIMRNFFGVAEKENLRKCIEQFNTGKLKSVQSFLNGENSENQARVDLAALLVDFMPRPLSRFLSHPAGSIEREVVEELHEGVEHNAAKAERNAATETPATPQKKMTLLIVAFMILCLAGYGLKELCFANEQCMLWKKDHFEKADCNTARSVWAIIEPLDSERVEYLRKVEVCDTTTFFKYGKPVIWYDKSQGEVTFFTYHGLNPENGHTLKPVTQYIISRHVGKCK